MEDVETMPTEPSERRRIQNRNAQRKYRRKTSNYASDGFMSQQLTDTQSDRRNLDRVYQARGDAPAQSLIDAQQQISSNNPWGGVDLSQVPPRNFLQEPCEQHSIHLSHVAAAFNNDNGNGNNGSILEASDPNYVFDSGYSSSVPNLSALSSISENAGQSFSGLPMTSLSTPGFLESLNNSLATTRGTPADKQLYTYADNPGILTAANSDPMDHNHNHGHNHSNGSPNHSNHSNHSTHSDPHENGANGNDASAGDASNSSNDSSCSKGPDDATDRSDWISMLHIASVRGHAHMISALLEHPLSIDERDSSGRTPLHLATANGHADVVRLLLSRGAGIDLEDSLGRTALHWTALQKHGELLRILLQRGVLMGRGADLNRRAKKCETWRREEPSGF